MQDEIEKLLAEHPSVYFSTAQVAEAMGISRSSAQRQLKKLLERGRIQMNSGRYGKRLPGPEPQQPISEVEEIARNVGIDAEVLKEWVAEKKASKTNVRSKRALTGILGGDVEKPGSKRPSSGEQT